MSHGFNYKGEGGALEGSVSVQRWSRLDYGFLNLLCFQRKLQPRLLDLQADGNQYTSWAEELLPGSKGGRGLRSRRRGNC